MQSWLILIVAIILEVAGTTAMKLSDGFTRPLPSVLLVVFYLFSLCCLCYLGWCGDGTGSDCGCNVVSRACIPVEGGFNSVDCSGSGRSSSQ